MEDIWDGVSPLARNVNSYSRASWGELAHFAANWVIRFTSEARPVR
jgi:hypothetical protein